MNLLLNLPSLFIIPHSINSLQILSISSSVKEGFEAFIIEDKLLSNLISTTVLLIESKILFII